MRICPLAHITAFSQPISAVDLNLLNLAKLYKPSFLEIPYFKTVVKYPQENRTMEDNVYHCIGKCSKGDANTHNKDQDEKGHSAIRKIGQQASDKTVG
jgi:hypothetical protein